MTTLGARVSSILALSLLACGGGSGGGGDAGPNFTADHPHIYLPHNRDRLKAALAAATPAAKRFQDRVDRTLAGDVYYDFQGWHAALLGQLTGDAKYCTYAVKFVDDQVTAEEALVAGGGEPMVDRDSYLYVGPTVGDIMLTYDWCQPALSDGQKTRWLAYANQAVYNVWNPDKATWNGTVYGWSGWSIDNPSNNYYYSFLRATMATGLAAKGEVAEADGWIKMFRDTKIAGELVPTFERDLGGGGSREGTGYGTSMANLFELYDFWQGSTGEDLANLTGHTRASLPWMLHAIVPTKDRIAPVGDHSRDSTAALFDYHRNYLQELAYLYPTDPIAAETKWTLDHSSVTQMDQPFMYVYDFLYEQPDLVATAPTLNTAYYAPGTGEIFARSSWQADATWLQAMAGPYSEVHAHHDQGQLLLFKHEWLAYDQNINSGSGIHLEEEVHNLVRLSRAGATLQQKLGKAGKVVALAKGTGYLYLALDLTDLYSDETGVAKVQREIVYLEPDIVVVFDRVDAGASTTHTWQLNSPITPTIAGPRATLAGGHSTLTVDRILPSDAPLTVLDWTTQDDMSAGARLDEAQPAGGDGRFLNVLSIDGAATAVAASDAGGQVGVTFGDAGGTSIVRFAPDAIGGQLILDGTTIDLKAGVATLPER